MKWIYDGLGGGHEGEYYTRSTTTFYNEHKKQLEMKDNGYYG